MKNLKFFASIIVIISIVSYTKKAAAEPSVSNAERLAESSAVASAQLDKSSAKLKNIDNAITWLERNYASRPKATEAAWEQCKYRAQGKDVSVALNCMKSILGD